MNWTIDRLTAVYDCAKRGRALVATTDIVNALPGPPLSQASVKIKLALARAEVAYVPQPKAKPAVTYGPPIALSHKKPVVCQMVRPSIKVTHHDAWPDEGHPVPLRNPVRFGQGFSMLRGRI
jgi:hypothetical protein